MPPQLFCIWIVSLLALFWFDPARNPKASVALWVPLIWFFFLASRAPVMWLRFSQASNLGQSLEEGAPLDRAIFSTLIVLAFTILVSRSFQWRKFVSQNSALVLYLAFALI